MASTSVSLINFIYIITYIIYGSCHTGVVTKELIHRSSCIGVATQEDTRVKF